MTSSKPEKYARKIWKGINNILNKVTNSDNNNISLEINNQNIIDPLIISNRFNEHFTSIANKIRDKIPPTNKHFSDYLKNHNPNSFFLSPAHNNEIAKTIKSLNINKSNGPNSIPSKLFINVADVISPVLTKIINISFSTGTYPNLLKTVKVIPIYKNKGSPHEVNNFRPISLLSNIDKVYEKIVYSRLITFLDKHKVITKKQFGFRNKHSTNHALISLTENIRKQLDSGNFSCGIFIDFQKAFDTVDHQILLSKLQHHGIRGIANSWFKSYLTNRKQFVIISGKKSTELNISHGVPQGSVLGPLLFLIYINDLLNAISYSQVFHFADDTSLLCSGPSLKAIKKRVNIDLKLLCKWLNANKIALNVAKTEVILFRHPNKSINYDVRLKLNGKKLTFSPSVRYLGITIDSHLNWSFHIKNLATKLSRSNGAISKLRHYVPQNILLSVYYSLFFSHTSYASQVWSQAQNIYTNRILKLQKTAVRLITFSDFNEHSKPLLKQLDMLDIFDATKICNISLVHGILNSNTPIDINMLFNLSFRPGTHYTRGSSITVRTSSFGTYSILYQCILTWNFFQSLFPSQDLSSLSIPKIKSICKDFLLNQYS